MSPITILDPQETASLMRPPSSTDEVFDALKSVIDSEASVFVPNGTTNNIAALRMRFSRINVGITARKITRGGVSGYVVMAKSV